MSDLLPLGLWLAMGIHDGMPSFSSLTLLVFTLMKSHFGDMATDGMIQLVAGAGFDAGILFGFTHI